MIRTILKLSVAVGLLTYLVSNGKLDFKLILKALESPVLYLVGLFMILIQCSINAIRWKLILSTQTSEKIPSLFIIMITWVGMFFNTILPGAVSGDLVKMVYLKKIDEKLTKTSMFLSVLMDRIYGLIALVLLTGIISIFRSSYLLSLSDEIKKILTLNLTFMAGIFLFISTLFLSNKIQDYIIKAVSKLPKIGTQISHLFECFWAIGKHKLIFFKSISISMVGQLLNLTAFYIITIPLTQGAVEIQDIYTFAPIGMILTAIPLAPGGMGVGHVAFDKLFQYLQFQNGADMFNIYWITMISINLVGVIPYLLLGKKKVVHTDQVEAA